MFLFRLARELGTADPRDLLDLDGAAWDGWLAYSRIEPFGPAREDLRAAEIACVVAAANGVRMRPEDLFESLRAEPEPSESRPRGRVGAGAMDGFARLCPALSPIRG